MHKICFIQGKAGALEVLVQEPKDTIIKSISVICHPDPQQKGSMEHKVVSTIVKALEIIDTSMVCIRFNFRGIGASEGEFGNLIGELHDCLDVIDWAQQQYPNCKLWLAGFSFGAYIAIKAAMQVPTAQLISVAPPVNKISYDWQNIQIDCPWVILCAEADEIVEHQELLSWYEHLNATKKLICFPNASHFFHGRLIDLKQALISHFS